MLPVVRAVPGTISMLSSSVDFDSGRGREVILGRCVAVLRFKREIKICPLLPKSGDQECPDQAAAISNHPQSTCLRSTYEIRHSGRSSSFLLQI